MMMKKLLIRQLNQELLAAAQIAYFAGVVRSPSLREHFLEFAHEELSHFSEVANILSEMGYEPSIEPLQLNLEKDELKALIILEAVEDTLIHYYEDMVAKSTQPVKQRIKAILEEERKHKGEMELLLREVKSALKTGLDCERVTSNE